MVAHAKDYKQTYSYAGILEGLSGMPFEVEFISFEDVMENPSVLKECGVIINVGDAYTAPSGGAYWENEKLVCALKEYVAEGGGLIGVGEPSAFQREGRYFTLANVLGVDKEIGFGLSTDKYNWEEHEHFITGECKGDIDFGEGMKNVYALPEAEVLCCRDGNVQIAVHTFGKGRSVYLSGLPYSFENSRLLYRSIFWAAGKEADLKRWYSSNYNIEINYYPATKKYCLVNNTFMEQPTVIYDGNGKDREVTLKENEIIWYDFLG